MDFQVKEAKRIASAFTSDLEGVVRISVPTGALTAFVIPAVREPRAKYPQIRLVFQNQDQLIDSSARKADISVRFTHSPDPNLIGTHVATSVWGFYANPGCQAEITRQLAQGLHPNVPLLTSNADNSFPDWAIGVFDGKSPCDYVFGFREKAELAAIGFGVATLPRIIGDAHRDLVFLNEITCKISTQLWVLANSDTRHSQRISTVRSMLIKGLKKTWRFFGSLNRPKFCQNAHGVILPSIIPRCFENA